MSCPADDMQKMSDTIDELKRIIELMKLKEKYVEPDCCDPMERGLDYWHETSEGQELERLVKKHCTT